MNVVVLAMRMVVIVVRVVMVVRMLMMVMIMEMIVIVVLRIGMVMFAVVNLTVLGMHAFAVVVGVVFKVTVVTVAFVRLRGQRRIKACALDDLALDPLAIAAAARVAVARTAAVGAILGFFLGLAMGAFVGLNQRLTIGDRDLVIIRVNFAEGQKTVAVAAIFDEGRLQGRLHARDLGEIDVAAKLFALSGLEIKLFDAIAADHNDPGFFRMGGID